MFSFPRYSSSTGIRKGVYNPSESLQELVSRIRKPESRLSDIDLVNTIVKYGIAFLLENENEKPIPTHQLSSIFRSLSHTEIQSETGSIDPDLLYCMRMLFDLPKTLAICEEILSSPQGEHERHGHFGVDLGSGTGILLLMQAIRAERNSIHIIHNEGVERNVRVAEKTKRLIENSLGMGTIVAGNSTKALFPCMPTFITNENIPARNIPFLKGNETEPFFQNLENLFSQYPKIFKNCHHFPRAMECNWQTQHGEISTFMVAGENNFGVREIFASNDPTTLSHISPNSIMLDGKMTPLDRIGRQKRLFSPLIVQPSGIRRW